MCMKIILDHVIRLTQGNSNFTEINNKTLRNSVFRQ